MVALTTGCIQELYRETEPPPPGVARSPITVQVLSVKKFPTKDSTGGSDRYRLMMSDGVYVMNALLGTQLSDQVVNGHIAMHSVIRLHNYTTKHVSGKNICVIMGLEVVENIQYRIGTPAMIESTPQTALNNNSSNSSANTTPQQQFNQQPQQPQQQQPQQQAAAPQFGQQNQGYSAGHASSFAAASVHDSGADDARVALPWTGPEPVLSAIKSLNPYQTKWTIKARVVQKPPIKTYNSARGEGKLFNVTLCDNSGEIRATGFNQTCDLLYPMLTVGKVYYISGCRVGVAKRQFSNVDNDYELSFDSNTDIRLCTNDGGINLPEMSFTFLDGGIVKIGELSKDAQCDVIGVIHACEDISEIVTKASGRTLKKRDMTLVDQSGYAIRTTLWGGDAEQFVVDDSNPHPIVAFRGVKVGDYGGRTLSLPNSGMMVVDPDIAEAHRLRGWYDNEGKSSAFSTFNGGALRGSSAAGPGQNRARPMRIEEVLNSTLGSGDKPDFFTILAVSVYTKTEGLYYPSCQSEGCSKKVIQDGTAWRCESCQKVYDSPEWRYIFNLNVSDESGSFWIQAFNEAGLIIFGITANELHALKEEDEAKYSALLKKSMFKQYSIRCRAKTETFNDVSKPRYAIQSITPMDYSAESKNLVKSIAAMAI
ncbi:replication factor-a protein [Ramicandelaber brevisporus]|nr:replication factor-a protein [Ramicandelaber brevisporus]